MLCSKPQKCSFKTLWHWSCICRLPRVSLLYAKEDLRRGFKLTIFRDGPESKDCKNIESLGFLWGLWKSFVPLLLPLEKGDVEPPKLPVQTLHWTSEVNWWKEEWGLCWVCSSPVLVIDLSMIMSKTTVLPCAVCITWCEAANCYNLIYCICNLLSNMRSCYLFLSWPVLLTFYHGRWFQRNNKTLPT